jgi:hypothetical protein
MVLHQQGLYATVRHHTRGYCRYVVKLMHLQTAGCEHLTLTIVIYQRNAVYTMLALLVHACSPTRSLVSMLRFTYFKYQHLTVLCRLCVHVIVAYVVDCNSSGFGDAVHLFNASRSSRCQNKLLHCLIHRNAAATSLLLQYLCMTAM